MLVLAQHILGFQFRVSAHLLSACSTSFHLASPPFSLRNWPYNDFSFHAACLSFSSCSSLFDSIFVPGCNFSVVAFRCCLQHNQRSLIFPVQHSLWHSAALYLLELLACTNNLSTEEHDWKPLCIPVNQY